MKPLAAAEGFWEECCWGIAAIVEIRPPGEAQMFGFPVAESGRLGSRSKNISFHESNCNQLLYCTKWDVAYFGMKNILN